MLVRTLEISDADLRELHDFLIEVGGFSFRGGGHQFFVMVGERFYASTGSNQGQVIMATSEAGSINVDVIAAGGGSESTELQFIARATSLIRNFAERRDADIVEV